jgi:hypothetical protein
VGFENVRTFSTVSKGVVVKTCDNFRVQKFVRPVPLVTDDLKGQERFDNFVQRVEKGKRWDRNNNQNKSWNNCSNNFQS